MELKPLGNTKLMVTPIGFGVLTVGATQLNLPIDVGASVLRYALDCGIRFLDTAQYYETYPYIKKALKGLPFDPVIASKCLEGGYSEMARAIEEARNEMDRDVIDIFLLHEVRSMADFQNRRGAWDCLNEAKAKGIVRAIGLSTHHCDVAYSAATLKECDVLFPLINFAGLGIRKGNEKGSREEMEAAIKLAAECGQGVFAMKVFGGGPLIGDYQKAMHYASSLAGITSLMIGFGSQEEVDRAIAFSEGILPDSYQPDLSRKKLWIDQGDCEGCGACLTRCPNNALYRGLAGTAMVDYDHCLTCGYCAPVCPVRAIIMISK